jgi:hypothetical protein
MAESVGFSRGLRCQSGAQSGFGAALKRLLSRLAGSGRPARLAPEEWPDYLLRDVGLDRRFRDEPDPRGMPMNWLPR